jgi:hypothetical protein
MDALTNMLKAVVAAVPPLVAVVMLGMETGAYNYPEIALLLLGAANAIGVYVVENTAANPTAKFWISVVIPVVGLFISTLTTGAFNETEFQVVVAGAVASILVYLAPNLATTSRR